MAVRSPTVRVTKKFTFEMAHALTGHDGPCKNIHGHSYTLSITVSGKAIQDSGNPKNGMVIDFADLKKIVRETVIEKFDHALVLNESDKGKIHLDGYESKLIFLPFAPTCEMLLQNFHQAISTKFPEYLKLKSMRLDETATSYAEWYADDNL